MSSELEFHDLKVAARAVITAYDDAPAFECPRCWYTPDAAIYTIPPWAEMGGLSAAIDALRTLLGVK